MAKTIANVLTGVATLFIRQPNDAIAEWSTTNPYVAPYSARLYKGGSGNDGSTCVEIDPTARGITFTAFFAGGLINNGFWHNSLNLEDAAANANYAQMEFKFEDPDSDGWVEITAVPLQTHLGSGIWVECPMTAAATPSGRSGVNEVGTVLFDWTLVMLDTQEGTINGLCPGTAANWILTRVRVELWEATPERTCYVDSVTIMGTLYAIEPGGNAPGLSLSSPYTEVGYTEDGVTVEYNAEEADIDVEEETFSIGRVITKESVSVRCNMAESSMYNLDKAMSGSALSGSIITLGDGVNKTMNLKIEGTNPSGFLRAIQIPIATATGSVGMSYKKGEKTVVPVTFQALKGTGPALTIVENAA